MAFTPGDPGEQSAADAAQSRSISEATGIGGGGDGSSGPSITRPTSVVGTDVYGPMRSLAQFSRLTPGEQAGITGVNIGKNIFGGTNYANQAKAVNAFINRYSKTQGPVNQIEFNEAQGITSKNPFGNLGLGTTMFGFNSSSLDYTDLYKDIAPQGTVFNTKNALGENVIKSGGQMQGMPAADYVKQYGTIQDQIAANQYSKYVNPENLPGLPGFNPQFAPGTPGAGKLRPGVQYGDYVTQYGPVMEQYRQLSPQELAARALIGLMPGGVLASQIDLKEYGLPGRKGYEDFNPENPRGPQTMLGEAFKDFKGQLSQGIGSTKQAIGDFFSPSTSANIPAEVQRFAPMNENMYGTGDLNLGETLNFGNVGTGPTPASNIELNSIDALEPGFSRTVTETLPDGRTVTRDKNTGAVIGIDLSSDLNSGIGSFDVAADVTGMRDVGGGMYRSEYGKSSLDRALDALGFGSGKKRPSGQIYSPGGKNPNMFQDIVSYFS